MLHTDCSFRDDLAKFNRVSKSLTFDGTAGKGAVGAVPLFTVTGLVIIRAIVPFCVTDLVGATATISFGITGSTALFLAALLATDIDAGELVLTATPPTAGLALPAAFKDIVVNANVIGTVAVAAITGGVLRTDIIYQALSSDGSVVAV